MAIEKNRKNDRLDQYFIKHMEAFVFDEFSTAYLQREGLESVMKEVAVPFRSQQLAAFSEGDGMRITQMIENMAWILGINPDFVYLPQYKAYMEHYFNKGLVEGIVNIGMKASEEGELEKACILFRGGLSIDPDNQDALYAYARACRLIFQRAAAGEGTYEGTDYEVEEYIGRFKAESMEAFEELTLRWPHFAPPHYFLGYAYLNMGLYRKAQLTWKDYLKYSDEEDTKKEIEDRLGQLDEPIEIEKGCNAVISGKWEEGIRILEPFISSDHRMWWPLHYYLGTAYARTGMLPDAEIRLKEALALVPSQIDCMEELAEVYKQLGNEEMEGKYRNKIEMLTNMTQKKDD